MQKFREDLLKIVLEKAEINDYHIDFHLLMAFKKQQFPLDFIGFFHPYVPTNQQK